MNFLKTKKATMAISLVAIAVSAALAFAADVTYNGGTGIYRTQGNQSMVFPSGTTLTLESGATFDGGSATITLADGTVVTAKLATDAVTAAKILAGAVTTNKLGTDAVTSAKILDGNVVTAKLGTDAVTSVKILDGNVVTAKLAAGVVVTEKLATDAVSAAKILAGAVTTDKLGTDSVTAAKILNGTITTGKLSGFNGAPVGAALCQKAAGGIGYCSGADASACTCN